MPGLYGAMSIALNSLLAEQGALEATTNNVANINTPGFSRQRPIFREAPPVVVDPLSYGSGVTLDRLESLRDPILELRMHEETQQQGRLDTLVSSLKQIEVMFSGSSGDLGDQINAFFNTLNQLSTDPASLSLRQGVLTAAGNLATTFQGMSSKLTQQRIDVDLSVGQSVEQVNRLTSEVAALNRQINGMENLGQDASAFIDQRTMLIRQLSNLIDVHTIQSDTGLALTTASGTALVAGQQSFALETHLDPSGVQHIFAQGIDITSQITSGQIAGILEVRDRKIPGLLSNLDTLAAGLATALNNAHHMGYDLNGDLGGDLFAAPPASGQGAAASFSVLITDPALLAASSDGTAGNNGNLANLAAVSDQPVAGGKSPTEYYSELVFDVGSDVSNAQAEADASAMILRQLEDQRGGISGVSLDEEAANLIRYQRAFEASARVITTVSEMLDTIINIGR